MRSLSLSTSSSRGRTYTRRGRVSDCQSASHSAISWATNCKFAVSQVAVRLSASYSRKAAAFRLPRNEVLLETTVVPEAHSPRISRLHNIERPGVGHSTTNAKLIKIQRLIDLAEGKSILLHILELSLHLPWNNTGTVMTTSARTGNYRKWRIGTKNE